MVRYGLGDTELRTKNAAGDNRWFEKPPKRGFIATKFVEFCNRTDLHGYKYIVMEDINPPERRLWALAVGLSIGVAAYFVVTAYRWYARNPIVTVIESTHGPVWDVPFPAITICDLNTISRRAALEFADNVTRPPNVTAQNVFEYLRWAPLLHSSFKANSTQKSMLMKLQDVLDLNKIGVETFFAKVLVEYLNHNIKAAPPRSPQVSSRSLSLYIYLKSTIIFTSDSHQMSPMSTCGQLVQRCMWKNTVYRCDMLFQQVFTQLNLCCVFNYFAVNITFTNINGPTEVRKQEAPRRVASCGYQTALTVLINTAPDDYYSSSVASQGALVLIDDSFNIPDLDSPGRMINPSTEVLISLSPERTYATPGIRSFLPEQRQCYYNDELVIGQFRRYSYHNCMAFKKVEYIKKTCDCLPFYFPTRELFFSRKCVEKSHMTLVMTDHYTFSSLIALVDLAVQFARTIPPLVGNGQEDHRKCNFRDLDCLEKLGAVNDSESTENDELQCLPECEHYDYPLEVALGILAKQAKLNGIAFFNDVNLENRSLLNVFFNDLVSTRYRRDVYLNWQNILASFGGLLSLMLGFTLISGFDLIIFFTFRIAYDALKTVTINENPAHEYANKRKKGHKAHRVMPDRSAVSKDFVGKATELDNEIRYGHVKY